MFKGLARRRAREADERISQAWHAETFARMKKLPPLKKVLGARPEGRQRKTGSELSAIAAQWHAALAARKS
ncbi:MAG: hypothetical protein VYD87_13290 [Pseudomonadota bacterium]|nr:hypothetical protein [Pseudomonadota bacterium]MEE3098832.1 hypothetical protein [Pseudomonadota bacterium]